MDKGWLARLYAYNEAYQKGQIKWKNKTAWGREYFKRKGQRWGETGPGFLKYVVSLDIAFEVISV